MPILGDLYQTLEEMGTRGEKLHTLLSRFVIGSARSFNAPTNVDLDNKFIALDVSYASDDMKAICMFIATDFVWDRCQADTTKKKVIALDEVWQLIGVNASKKVANFVLNIFKLIRGYGGMAIAATQDISDFFSKSNGDIGKAIVNSSEIKMILKLKKNEADFTRNVINLSDDYVDRITNKFKQGDALLMAGLNNVFIHVEASKTEHAIITTRRDELEKLAGIGGA
jgi:type IV secretory pathway VirB4 component